MEQTIQTNHYSVKYLMRYAAPTISVMIFISIYTMIDGIFVARYVNATALAAVNIFMPVYAFIFAIALMLGTGGSAIIAKKMGENKYTEARSNFTLIVLSGGILGLVIAIFGSLLIQPLMQLLGAGESAQLLDYTMTYAKIILMTAPFLIVQAMFEALFVTAGRAKLSLFITIIGGSTNIILDYVFIAVMGMGIRGAALATAIGVIIPAVLGVLYFFTVKTGDLYFTRFQADWRILLKSCSNGASEMVTNLSSSVVTYAFNVLMLTFIGVEGVAAVTILLYVMFVLTPFFVGYSVGIAPLISFHYGSRDTRQLKQIFKNSFIFIGCSSLTVFGLSLLLGPFLIQFMAVEGNEVYAIAKNGLWIFSAGFLFMGFNIFTSMLFTALSNGKVSAGIALIAFAFEITALATLPFLFGINGIWITLPLAELLTLGICGYFLSRHKNRYQYA